jgi:hypothetical protein
MSATFEVNQVIRGLYPASNGEGLMLREGTIDKVGESKSTGEAYAVVKIADGYRTFTLSKLIVRGDVVNVKTGETTQTGYVQSISEDCIAISESKVEHNPHKWARFTIASVEITK